MNKLKKAFALVLALAIVMSLGITAFAAESTLTVVNPANSSVNINGQTFTAYKVFDVTHTTETVPSTTPGGQDTVVDKYSYKPADKFADFAYDFTAKNTTGAAAVKGDELVKALEGLDTNSSDLYTFAKAAHDHAVANKATAYTAKGDSTQKAAITVPGDGYYVIVGNAMDGSNKPVVVAMALKTAIGNTEVNLKAKAPTITKKAKDVTGGDTAFKDDITAAVGSTVQFQLTTKVPNMAGYDHYFTTFRDKVSTGLKLLPGVGNADIVVKIGTTTLDASEYTIAFNAAGDEFAVTMNDLVKSVAAHSAAIGDDITVTYNALVTADSITRLSADNSAILKYDDDPSNGFGGNPAQPDEPFPEPMDPTDPTNPDTPEETPKAVTHTYNFDLKINKVNEKDAVVAGAKFVVYKENAQNVKSYYKYDSAADGNVSWVASEKNATVGLSDSKGIVNAFKGLKAGTYYLQEIEAPQGYNMLKKPIEIKITANLVENTDKIKSFTVSVTDNNADVPAAVTEEFDVSSSAKVSDIVQTIKVVNKSGKLLPETGGIGTTIFYTVGSIMMVSALVLLITKKKMSAN